MKMGKRAIEKDIQRYIWKRNKEGYVESVIFNGTGTKPKGWKWGRGPYSR